MRPPSSALVARGARSPPEKCIVSRRIEHAAFFGQVHRARSSAVEFGGVAASQGGGKALCRLGPGRSFRAWALQSLKHTAAGAAWIPPAWTAGGSGAATKAASPERPSAGERGRVLCLPLRPPHRSLAAAHLPGALPGGPVKCMSREQVHRNKCSGVLPDGLEMVKISLTRFVAGAERNL